MRQRCTEGLIEEAEIAANNGCMKTVCITTKLELKGEGTKDIRQ
jgi:hypothetical protein